MTTEPQTYDQPLIAGVGPNVETEPVGLEAAPPLVSLLSTAADVTTFLDGAYGSDRWINGFSFEPEVGALILAEDFPWYWSCPDGANAGVIAGRQWTANVPGGVKQVPNKPANVTYRPFGINAADPCLSTFGMFGRDAQARAKRILAANLSRILENELWTGARSTMAGFTNPFLTSAPTKPNGNTATAFIEALGDLEQGYAAVENRPGFIHVQPRIVALWRAYGLVTPSPSGKQLLTALGNYVVPGGGYDGSGTGIAAGDHTASWGYMTGPVVVARTPIVDQVANEHERMAGTLQVSQDRETRAECYGAAFWDGKTCIGVKINHLLDIG